MFNNLKSFSPENRLSEFCEGSRIFACCWRWTIFRDKRCWCGVNLTSRKHCRHCTAARKRRTRSTMKIVTRFVLHGGNGKRIGGNPILRIHQKDGVTTDWTGKPVYSARIEFKIFIVIISVTVDSSLFSPDGGVFIEYFLIQQFTNKWLRKIVCNDKYTFQHFHWGPLWTITRMTRRTRTCATCRIEHTCTLSFVSSFDSFITPHGSRPFAFVIPSAFHPCVVWLWVSLFRLLLLPVFLLPLPVLLDDRRWLHDNQ